MSRPPQNVRCKVTKNARGEPLKPHWAMHGQKVCRVHGGRSPQAKRAAEQRQALARVEKEARSMTARDGVNVHPMDHLLDSLHIASNMVAVFSDRLSEHDQRLTQSSFITGQDQIHPFATELKDWLKERARISKMCLDAGIEDRRMQQAEYQAHLLVDPALAASNHPDLNLTADQRMVFRKLLAEELRRRRPTL